MKRAAVILATMLALMFSGIAVAAPSQAKVPTAKQVAKMLKCGAFHSTTKTTGKYRERSVGKCVRSGVEYEIADYGTHKKNRAILVLIDIIAQGFSTKTTIGYGWTWMMWATGNGKIPAPMRKTIRHIGGTVRTFG